FHVTGVQTWLFRSLFHAHRLLGRILSDLDGLLNLTRPWKPTPFGPVVHSTEDVEALDEAGDDVDVDPALPGALWSDTEGTVAGGISYGGDDSGEGADFAAWGTDTLAD